MLMPYHVSWWDDPIVDYTLLGPFWISGQRTGHYGLQPAISAAVMAMSIEDAQKQILDAHDLSVDLEWRFTEEMPFGWVPFYGKNLPHRDKMIWNQHAN